LKTWEINDKEIDPVFEAVKIGLEDASNKARETSRDAYGYLYHYHQRKAEKLKNDLPKATQAKLVISLDGLNFNNNFPGENAESAFSGTGGSGGGGGSSGKMSGNNSPSKTTTSGHSNSNSFSSSNAANAHKSVGILKTPSSSSAANANAAAAPAATSVTFATQHVRSQSGNITFNNPTTTTTTTPSHPLVPHVNSNNSMNTSNNSINTSNTNNNNSNSSMNSNPSTGMLPPHPLVSGSASKSGSFTINNNNSSNNNLSTGNNPATGGGTPNPLLMNKVPANADAYTSGTKIATMSSVDHNSLALQAGVRNALSRRRSVVKNPFAELSDSMKAASSDSGTTHSTGHSHSHHSHHHSIDLKAAQHDFIQSNSQPKSIRGGGGVGKKDSDHNRTYSMDDSTVISALTSHTTQYQQQPPPQQPQTPLQQPAVSLLSLPKNPAQTTANILNPSNMTNNSNSSTNSAGIMGASPFQSNDFTPTRQEKKLPQQLLSSDNSLPADK
jgi:hypothetical protein